MRKTFLTLMCAAAAAVAVGGAAERPAYADPPNRDQIRKALEEGVDALIRQQQEDGSWEMQDVAHGGDGYDVARTALAVLALQNAQRHVNSAKVLPAINKGLAFIVQQWPEPKTYTAGLVQQVLQKADPTGKRYWKHASMYGWTLVYGQLVIGPQTGGFGYGLYPFPKDFNLVKNVPQGRNLVEGRADNSNSQFGILGLLFSHKMGVQIPAICWLRAQKYYMGAQHQDGSWDYYSDPYRQSIGATDTPAGTPDLTCAGTVSLAICNEMIYGSKHDQCKPQPSSEPVEKGLEWIAKNWTDSRVPYGWYAIERLGILMGYSEFGGHDWYEAGSTQLIGGVLAGSMDGWGGPVPSLSFGIIFLSRGLEPIIFNKLKRTGDWNLHLHDIAHVTEYLSSGSTFQYSKQWRIVTLNSSVEYLLRVPILWISGHDKLIFTDEEKQKLKAYVEGGGTILGEACCSQRAFDQSFRALMAEFWPDATLQPLPPTHPIYNTPRPRPLKAKILGLAINANQGRIGVLYIPNGFSCQWQRGGTGAIPAFDLAANIHFYVEKIASRRKTPEEIEQEKVPAVDAPAPTPSEANPQPPRGEVDEEGK